MLLIDFCSDSQSVEAETVFRRQGNNENILSPTLALTNLYKKWKTWEDDGGYLGCYRVVKKKVFHKSEGKMQKKNEDDLAESWKLGTCETTLWWFYL